MSGRVFVDTNILIYAYDLEAGGKHTKAARVVEDLWTSKDGTLSVQVLQEFYVNVTRKIRKPLTKRLAREVIEAYATWHVEAIGAEDVVRASLLEERYKLSFWDALIVVAAKKAGADRVLSEDLNPGQRVDGVLVENPL
jgi:predicted nucleic acid-binding protein